MTASDRTPADLHPSIVALADLIAENDLDIPAALEALQPHLIPSAFEGLALALDACPIHLRDLDGCADDDDEALDEQATPQDPALDACRRYRTRG